MKINRLIIFLLGFIVLPLIVYGGELKVPDKKMTFSDRIGQQLRVASDKLIEKHKDDIISEEEAIKIAMNYLRMKTIDYEVDWEDPHARLERKSLKKDGSLSNGFGKKVLVWWVWFLPRQGTDFHKGITRLAVDINAKTGEVFTKYSVDKL